MAWGPRPVVGLIWATCASCYVSSTLHGCRWSVGFPQPPGPFCLGPGRCVLSRPAEFHHDDSFFSGFFGNLSTPEVAILKVVCMFHPSHRHSFSFDTGRWKAPRRAGKYGGCKPSRFRDATLINGRVRASHIWPKTRSEDNLQQNKYVLQFLMAKLSDKVSDILKSAFQKATYVNWFLGLQLRFSLLFFSHGSTNLIIMQKTSTLISKS